MGTFSVVVRTSASERSGLGHLRRCLALAHAFRRRRGAVAFWVEDGPAVSLVEDAGFPARLVNAPALPEAGAVDVLVADAYHYDVAFIAEGRRRARLVMAIVDFPGQDLPAQLVLDTGRMAGPARRQAHADTMFLFGPAHALLAPHYAERPARGYSRRVRRILITVGSTDPAGLTRRLVTWAHAAVPDAVLDVIVGPFFPSDEPGLVNAVPSDQLRTWTHPPNLRTLMLDSDIAIAGAGQTVLELAACGTPTIAMALVDNQERHVDMLAGLGAVVSIGSPGEAGLEQRLSRALQGLADARTRQGLGRRARQRVDGRGAARVAAAVVARLQREPAFA